MAYWLKALTQSPNTVVVTELAFLAVVLAALWYLGFLLQRWGDERAAVVDSRAYPGSLIGRPGGPVRKRRSTSVTKKKTRFHQPVSINPLSVSRRAPISLHMVRRVDESGLMTADWFTNSYNFM